MSRQESTEFEYRWRYYSFGVLAADGDFPALKFEVDWLAFGIEAERRDGNPPIFIEG